MYMNKGKNVEKVLKNLTYKQSQSTYLKIF